MKNYIDSAVREILISKQKSLLLYFIGLSKLLSEKQNKNDYQNAFSCSCVYGTLLQMSTFD